ncbi:MAG: DUF3800 domain-containing protein [Rickettsiales bacterium]|jgi:hypothetical protein|nr:DUF3800 domain-containing protein [Rickettsiales bacterium]
MSKILYLDESGTSNLKKIDVNYPIFMLGGIIIDQDDLAFNENLINELKLKHWSHTGVILHSSEIVHRRGDFAFLNQPEKWREFLSDMNSLMKELKYQVVACIIDIRKLSAKYGKRAFDPYEYALRIIIERFIYSMARFEQGSIFAESRGKPLDTQISQAFDAIKETGNGCFIDSEEICAKIQSFAIKQKSENLAGLQLADLALPPLGRRYLDKGSKKDYEIILEKCLSKGGKTDGYGIVILPK